MATGTQELKNWTAKLDVSEIRLRDGRLDPMRKVEALNRLTNSIMDTWKDNGSVMVPMVKIHVDGRFVYTRLLAVETDDYRGPVWRNQFDDQAFRKEVEKGVALALANFEAQRHDRGILITARNVGTVDIDRLGDPKPRLD